MDFAGRVVVVSGGATGMGRATVELLLERGARVALIDWNRKEAEAISRSENFKAYVADVSGEDQVQQAFSAIDRDFGHIHGLFSNAGVVGIDAAAARARLDRGLQIVRALHNGGVRIVAGTDEGIPGHSLHRELELYVEAGFTDLEALQSATIVAARAMKVDGELGTIERGKRADLVVLDANPLEAIANIRRVRWVMTAGRLDDPTALWRSVGFRR